MARQNNAIKNKEILKKRKDTVSEDLCADCPALCCNDLVMIIDKPKTKSDLDTYKWYIQYNGSSIYILDNKWYHIVRGVCQYLDRKTKLCKIYDERPNKCRKHLPPNCEKYGDWYDVIFDSPDTLQNYVEKHRLIKQKSSKKR